MSDSSANRHNPELDLLLERNIDVPRNLVWAAWTTPDLIMKWFTPAPWQTVACEIDLRPGGAFNTVMRSPDGEEFPNEGCLLEIVENERLVWTNALQPGFRPIEATPEPLLLTGVISLRDHGNGTAYSAMAIHRNAEDRAKHEAMGFREGWGKALDQLVDLVKQR